MPKAPQLKRKYYAVKIGAQGPKIYDTWEECKENVSRYPGAIHKSFTTLKAAEAWLEPIFNAFTKNSVPNVRCAKLKQEVEIIEIFDSPPPSPPLPPAMSVNPINPMPVPVEVPGAPPTAPAAPPTAPSAVELSPEQRDILEKVKDGRNVFFTGSAGTGKSVLLREIIRSFCEVFPREQLAITASTGIASVNIGGTTLHSWAGIGLGKEPAEKLVGKIAGNKNLSTIARRWRTVRTLIIDEISMIDGTLFDKLEYIGRHIRRVDDEPNPDPFGGIQLVLSGDFYQLPPVPGTNANGQTVLPTFAFDAKSWKRCMGLPVTLKRVFRQKDQEFVDMLNAMRYGDLDEKTIKRFAGLSRPVVYHDGIEPTELYPTRREVEEANHSRLNQIQSVSKVYEAQDTAARDKNGNPKLTFEQMTRLLERLVAPKTITLKVGAQVMMIKNIVQGVLVNGSVGKVVELITYKEAVERYLPIAVPGDKENGQDVPEYIRKSTFPWPLVKFTNGLLELCVPAEFTVEDALGEIEATRMQIPLILAWALSVHKSQGQTLERVRVDLRRTFEKGQAYVALSRATNMDTLQVLNFNPSKVMAHPRVLDWNQELQHDEEYDEYDQYNERNDIDDDLMDSEEAVAGYHVDI